MHIDIKIIFGYKQHRLKIDKEKKINDDKEVNSTWTRIDRWLRHHLSRTKWLLIDLQKNVLAGIR